MERMARSGETRVSHLKLHSWGSGRVSGPVLEHAMDGLAQVRTAGWLQHGLIEGVQYCSALPSTQKGDLLNGHLRRLCQAL